MVLPHLASDLIGSSLPFGLVWFWFWFFFGGEGDAETLFSLPFKPTTPVLLSVLYSAS